MTREANTADLVRKLYEQVQRQSNSEKAEGTVEVVRSVTDTETSSDTVSATEQSPSSFDWSPDATWGFDTF